MQKIHRISQGEDGAFKLPFLYAGLPTPVDGWPFWFTVSRLPDDVTPAAALFQKSTADGSITAFDATTLLVSVAAADTRDQETGRYYFHVQGRQPGGALLTLEKGVFYIDPVATASAT
jgi:hypothetical protein